MQIYIYIFQNRSRLRNVFLSKYQEQDIAGVTRVSYCFFFDIYAEVVNFWGRVEAKGLPAIQRGGCPTER